MVEFNGFGSSSVISTFADHTPGTISKFTVSNEVGAHINRISEIEQNGIRKLK